MGFMLSNEGKLIDSLVFSAKKGDSISDSQLVQMASHRSLQWAQARAHKAAIRCGKKLERVRCSGYIVMLDIKQATDTRRIEHRRRDLKREIAERSGVDVTAVPPVVLRFNEFASNNAAIEFVSHTKLLKEKRKELRKIDR